MYVSPLASVLSFRGVRPVLGDQVFLAPGARIIGDVMLGDQSSVWYNAVLRGDIHFIRIGRKTNIQDGCVLHVTADTHPVTIGHRVTVGHAAIIHGATIEDGCLIGMGAKILDGARVGAGAMVAAGSVVRPGAEIPPGVLAAGVPARVKRELTASESEEIALSSELYLGYSIQHALELGLIPGKS
jgi:carbonic anhydrase/acetyltransferase-like protein (isoleucine patch superfamily)